jgi:hypothetical protein
MSIDTTEGEMFHIIIMCIVIYIIGNMIEKALLP